MNRTLFSSLLILLFLLTATNLFCQVSENNSEPTKYLISMVEKKIEYIGTIEKGTKDSIWIKVDETIHAFHIDEVGSINVYDYDTDYPHYERNAARYVLAPTALSLKRGEAYYQNLLFVGGVFGFGVTENFSITIGTVLPTIIYNEFVGYFAPKISVEMAPNFHTGLGVITGINIDTEDFYLYELMVVPFINSTIGNVDNNLTIGLGLGVKDPDLENRVRAGMFAFKLRFAEKINLVSESTFTFADSRFNERVDIGYFGSHVFRYSKRKNSIDLGLVLISLFEDLTPIPYIGYTRSF